MKAFDVVEIDVAVAWFHSRIWKIFQIFLSHFAAKSSINLTFIRLCGIIEIVLEHATYARNIEIKYSKKSEKRSTNLTIKNHKINHLLRMLPKIQHMKLSDLISKLTIWFIHQVVSISSQYNKAMNFQRYLLENKESKLISSQNKATMNKPVALPIAFDEIDHFLYLN